MPENREPTLRVFVLIEGFLEAGWAVELLDGDDVAVGVVVPLVLPQLEGVAGPDPADDFDVVEHLAGVA